ncbi:hypothetical protein ACVI1J_010375 [Bradyrhizobium diazoefficiens]
MAAIKRILGSPHAARLPPRPLQFVNLTVPLNTLEYLEQYHSVTLNGAKTPALDSRISNAFVNSSDPNSQSTGSWVRYRKNSPR